MQKYTSMNTSINKTKVPAVFRKVDWEKFRGKTVLDYGCGRYTEHIEKYLEQYGVRYVGYDPYWRPERRNIRYDVVVCSNVLNVIDDDNTVYQVHGCVRWYNEPYFITVYEGDGSGIGRQTGKDQYQRNEKAGKYLWSDECVSHGVITAKEWKEYLK